MLFYLIDAVGTTSNSLPRIVLEQFCENVEGLRAEQALVLSDQIIFLREYVLDLFRDVLRLNTLLLIVLIWVQTREHLEK